MACEFMDTLAGRSTKQYVQKEIAATAILHREAHKSVRQHTAECPPFAVAMSCQRETGGSSISTPQSEAPD